MESPRFTEIICSELAKIKLAGAAILGAAGDFTTKLLGDLKRVI